MCEGSACTRALKHSRLGGRVSLEKEPGKGGILGESASQELCFAATFP